MFDWLRPIAFEYLCLHCSWNAAHDCEHFVTMSDIEIDVKYLDAKMSWIIIIYFFFIPMHKSCVCVELVAPNCIWMCIFLHRFVKCRSWSWRYGDDVGHGDWRETWNIFGCENFMKFYSNSISVHILRLSNTPPLFFAKSYFLLLSWTLGACLHLLCVWTIFLSLPAMIVTKIMKSCLSQ